MKFHKSHPFSPHEKCFFYKVKRSERFTQQHYATFLLGCILLMLLPEISRSQAVLNSDWPIRVLSGVRTLTHCEGLGFPNSTKNECGFCVGGATGLAENFGKDCSGTCGGKKVIDCNGVCDGSAYVDECSGLCIGGTTNIKEGDAPNPHRDCRGYCLTSGGQYFLDTCGVCNGGRSPFEDCTNKCHLPGQEDRMAKLVCSRCVGGSSQVSESQVLDACGNCKSEEQKCVCNGVGEPDPCDKCNDGGKSCMRALSFAPQAAPNQTEFDLLIKGAFRGRRQYLRCLLTPVSNDEIGLQLEFVGTSNGTHLKCRVTLISGTYRVGASLVVGEKPEISSIEDAELLIYDDANYVSMAPLRTIFDRDSSKELILTFTGGKVPPRPLTCIISGTGWPPGLRIAPGDPNSHHTCILPYANTSVRINVAPSLNGIHPLTNTFSFTFYSSPPEMKKYYIAEDGHAVIIVFDRPVKLCNLKTCSDMLNNETLERLGGNATCQWATKQQLVITVQRPITGNPMRITFKKEVLMQDDQEYPLSKNEGLTIDAWYPQPSSRAQLAISGSSTLPFCGNFTLVGHFSSPKGDAQFFWTAYRGDRQRLEHIIAQALLGVRKATLTLDIALLEVGMNYTFVLTAQHPVNDKYEARHIVERKPYSGALITAYSDVMNQPSVSASQAITLQAEVSLPECYTEGESVQLLWSVNNALVKFDFGSRDSYLYKILPYSLPDNTEITFYAMAYFINLENVTSSKVKLNVEPHILKAAIKGSSKRSVGNRDGFLVLESADDNGGLPLVYQWRCYDKNDICYNYGRDATSALLIDREKQKSPVLTIPLENLKAGQVLTFELQVFNAKNRYHSSSAASTIVVVENGSIPQVVVQSVSSDGIGVFERNPTTTAYSIPARLPIMIHATINVTSGMQLKSVEWDIKGVSAPFGYSTLNTDTYLMLEEGFLIDHGIFLIGLSACTVENVCGIANLTIHAVPGTTLCQLDTPSFIEYEWVQASVVGCSIPTGRQPLTYQLFVSINGTLITLTPPQTPTVFEFYGPPVSQGNISQFYLQVCDKYNLCKLFPGDLVKSFENEVKMVDRMKLFDKAKRYSKTNNPVPALALYLTAAMDTKTPLKLDETKAMVDSARSAVVNRYVNSGQLSLVYSAMLPLLRQDDKQVKGLALAVMRTATNQAYSYDVRPPTSVLALGHGNAMEAIRNTADDSVMQKVRATQHTIVKFISRTLQLGSRRVLPGGDQGQPSTVVFRQLLSRDRLSITAQDADGKTVEGTVAFEPDVRNRFMQWRSSESQQICNGVVVSLTLYPGASPYPKAETLVSPIFDVSMRDPSTGNIMSQSFGDESDSVRLSITNLGNLTQAKAQGKVFKCMYWDDSAKEWTMYGVKTMGLEGDAMTCWASHLSTFAVFEMTQELSREKERLASLYNKGGLSTSSIVGIVVAVLVGVFIIGMFLFFFMRKKQAKSVRVSTETLQPKHIEKMKGMERTIAHVKKFAMN